MRNYEIIKAPPKVVTLSGKMTSRVVDALLEATNSRVTYDEYKKRESTRSKYGKVFDRRIFITGGWEFTNMPDVGRHLLEMVNKYNDDANTLVDVSVLARATTASGYNPFTIISS